MKILKKSAIVAVLFTFIGFSLNAQSGSSFGLKGGLNYGANGDYIESIGENAKNPENNTGYHFGVFGKLGGRLYVRPELVYTATKSDYGSDTFEVKKMDLPLLVGVKIIGPISVFAGPSFQYILDSDFGGTDVDTIENDITVGFNFGVGFSFRSIGLDLRYERGFSDNEAVFIDNNIESVSKIDTRPNQLILSLSIAL